VNQTAISLCLLLILVGFPACDREAPPKPIGAATNKHVEQSPAMNSPLEQARQAEGVVKGSAEERDRQAEQATP
jgi:hypothetical protein